MKRMYTVMESTIGETKNKVDSVIGLANEMPSLVTHKNDSTIHVTPDQKSSWDSAVVAVGDIGNKSNLLTTNKTNLVSAVNELFTNANNGKTAVSSAVTAKGVAASPTDTFAVLATKIGQINTGKKFAEGTLMSTLESMTISNLTFRPSIVIVKQANSTGVYTDTYNYVTAVYYGLLNINTGTYNFNSSNWLYQPEFVVNDTGFRCKVIMENTAARERKWIAIE